METEKQDTKELTLRENFKILLQATKSFWLINVINFGDGIAYFGVLILLTRFLGTRVGLSDQVTGFSVSLFTGLVTLFMLIGGYISDKIGVRRALTLSLALIGLGRVILVMSPSMGMSPATIAWIGIIIYAMGEGVIQPALYAGIKEYTDPRTATIGYSLLYSIMNLGSLVEHFLSPYVRTDGVFLDLKFTKIVGLGWGIDGVYWVCIAITGAMLLIHISFFTKKVELKERIIVEDKKEKKEEVPFWVKVKQFPLLDLRFVFFIFILLPVRTLFAHQWLTLPDYVFRCFPESIHDKYEWISGLNPFIIILFVPLFAALTRKTKVIDMMIIGTIVTAVTSFLLVNEPNVTFLITYVILFSLGEALWSSRFLEYIAHVAPAGKVGLYMGFAGMPWFLAKTTTGLYSGILINKFIPAEGAQDPSTLWLFYGCIAVISPIGLILGRKFVLSQDKIKEEA